MPDDYLSEGVTCSHLSDADPKELESLIGKKVKRIDGSELELVIWFDDDSNIKLVGGDEQILRVKLGKLKFGVYEIKKHLTEQQTDIMREHGIGLKEICEHWVNTYPKDIFVGKTPEVKLIVEIRELMEKILELGK